MASVVIWMAVRYDDRQRKPLEMTYAVMAIVLLISCALIGYWAGQQVDQQVRKNDEQTTNKLNELRTLSHSLEEQLLAEKAHVEKLRVSLSKVPQYERETVTSVDEVRGTVTNSI